MPRAPESGRASAVIDAGAIERNCATLARRPHRRRRALRGRQGRRLRSRRRRSRPARRCAAAPPAWPSRPRSRPRSCRFHFAEAPILVMGAMTGGELRTALWPLTQTSRSGARASRRSAHGSPASPGRRYGSTSSTTAAWGASASATPTAVVELARACADDPHLELAGVWTHFATADEDDGAYLARAARILLPPWPSACARSSPVSSCTRPTAPRLSASRRAHFDMVRCGVAIYGLDPFQRDPADQGLEPALELRSYVGDVKRFEAGASAGYGRTWSAPADTWVGVLPIGYGDGVRRGTLQQRRGAGPRPPPSGGRQRSRWTTSRSTSAPRREVEPGDEAVLIGAQGEERSWPRRSPSASRRSTTR